MGAPATVVDLSDPAALEARLAGGKASSLAALIRAGFPVPTGFCLTTAAYAQFAAANGIEPPAVPAGADPPTTERIAEKIRERFARAAIPEPLLDVLHDAYHRLTGDGETPAVAVRSSATLEDMADASFAGQYRTLLGVVGDEALIEAVRDCWLSLWGAPALIYRASRDLDASVAGVAVIVQRLVDADVSGVAFSRNPLTGENEVVVDASWGLGEAVVSGWATPDHYRLGSDGEVLERNVANKRWRTGPGGREPVPEALVRLPCLDDDQLREVAQLAERTERAMGSPQDIEFALAGGKLWLLQARPITTPLPGAGTGPGRAPRTRAAERPERPGRSDLEPLLAPGMQPWPGDHWSRAVADEYWADAVTPFTFGSLGTWIDRDTTKAVDRILGFNDIDPARPTLRHFRAHAYWNADVIATGFKYLPHIARGEAVLAYLPPKLRETAAVAPTACGRRLRGELLMRLRDRQGTIRRNHRALAAHSERVRRACGELDRVELAGADLDELDRYWQTIDELGRAHFAVIRWGMQEHSLMLNFILARLLADWLGDDGRMFAALIGGAGENLTLETNREIWKLAQLAGDDAAAGEIVSGLEMPTVTVGANPPNPNYESLLDRTGDGRFARALQRFLVGWGHRAFTRDLGLPRWVDQPDAVLGLIAQAPGAAGDPAERMRAAEAERAALERDARCRLRSGGTGGRARHAVFDLVLRYARIYTAFRENQRFTLDYVLLRARRAALAYGGHLAGAGLASDPGDVFYLTLDEVRRALAGSLSDAGELIAARREAYTCDSHGLPPLYLRGDEPLEGQPADGDAVLQGMPVSGGRVVARCRVVREPDEATRLASGEVMVAPNTDPGWTPLFMSIGGVVLETGGVLAHGAIVAREYGIPAVTAVEAATQRIADGEWVTVDGWAGRVERHGDKRPPIDTNESQP